MFDDETLGALTDVKQQHDGAVDGSSPKVTISYVTLDASSGNFHRVNSIVYPSGGMQVDHLYGLAGISAEDRISRLTALVKNSFSPKVMASYDYIGLSMPAVVDYAWQSADVQLDFSAAHNGVRSAGTYPGYDRFGRIIKQMWV